MKKVFKFVTGRRDGGNITPSQSGDLAQTPTEERFLGLDTTSGYIVDFCGKDKSLTKLHKAAWQGNVEKLKCALKKVDIDAVDRHNRSSLHFAVVQGHPNIVWFLLGNNAKMTICDDEGKTPLLKAIECAHKECMTLLLERGANVNTVDYAGNSGLHIAALQGYFDISAALLKNGADLECANTHGEYPLHIATRSKNKDLVELLLRSGASVNVGDRDNRTPLMLAAKNGHLYLAQLFLEYGAYISVVDSNGWTAEDYAMLGGHQDVAAELKTLSRKIAAKTNSCGSLLETHCEVEEENEQVEDESLSEMEENKKVRKEVVTETNDSRGDEEDSPNLTIVPPLCQPPRSWDMIQAGMIDDNNGEGKRRSLTALGSLCSRRESFTEQVDVNNKKTLSLNRKREDKKGRDFAKQRFSFHEEDSVKSLTKEELEFYSRVTNRKVESCESDWDNNSERETSGQVSSPAGRNENGTFGRFNTMKTEEEVWVQNEQIKLESLESTWDSMTSGDKDDSKFPTPPSDLELGVDLAKSMSYIKGVSIDHPDSLSDKNKEWKSAYDSQSHSLDCLDEKIYVASNVVETDNNNMTGKTHARHQSISSQKWRSEELPQCQRPPDRLADVNRRISEQLECYDQALRELAESSYAKRQDAIISTLTSDTSNVQNYYSLPASKIRQGRLMSELTSSNFVSDGNYYYEKPPFGYKPFIEMSSGPLSLSFFVNNDRKLTDDMSDCELGNDEKLGAEDTPNKVKSTAPALDEKYKVVKKKYLNEDVENRESPLPDELSDGNSKEKKSKRHMLLAMRDVKHAVRHSLTGSADDQILSPLTKQNFDIKSSSSSSECESTGDQPFWKSNEDTGLIGRQETVIERNILKKNVSSSEEEEPTLWLQDQEKLLGTEGNEQNFSPFKAVYDEIRKEKEDIVDKSSSSVCSGTPSPTTDQVKDKDNTRSMSSEEASTKNECGSSDNEENVASPDISLSSGPIEQSAVDKDSGSDVESSQNDITPTHQSSLKKHREWLKRNLRTTTSAKSHLEEVAAELTERAERLQYELTDAKEAAKSRDEVIILLQGQLSKMEVAYTKSLEESVRNKLQLTSNEQEIYHLKELCAKYEEEKEIGHQTSKEWTCKDHKLIMKQLEDERSKMKKEMSRLENENRILEKRLKESNGTELLDQCQRWKERCQTLEQTIKDQEANKIERSLRYRNSEEVLKMKSADFEKKLQESLQKNKILEEKNQNLEKEMKQLRENDENELHKTIQKMKEKNEKVENDVNKLKIELNEKRKEKDAEIEFLVDQFEKERLLLTKSFEKMLETKRNEINEENEKKLKEENERLKKKIGELENLVLKPRPNTNLDHGVDSLVLIEENLKLKTENNNLRCAKSDLETCQIKNENSILKNQIFELKKQLKLSNEQKNKDEQKLFDFKILNKNLQEQLKTINIEMNKNGKIDGLGNNHERILKKRESDKENGEAWKNLYGIKNVGKREIRISSNETVNLPDQEKTVKVENLEKELEKAKEEITLQKLELKLKFGEGFDNRRNSEIIDMKKQLRSFQQKLSDESCMRQDLEEDIVKINKEMKESQRLESEIISLKNKIDRDMIGKSEIELLKLQESLKKKKEEIKLRYSAPDESLKLKCERLARERMKQHDMKVKNIIRKSMSYERIKVVLPTHQETRKKFHSFPRDDHQTSSAQLNKTKNKQPTIIDGKKDVLNRSSSLEATTSGIEMALLKKKYLC